MMEEMPTRSPVKCLQYLRTRALVRVEVIWGAPRMKVSPTMRAREHIVFGASTITLAEFGKWLKKGYFVDGEAVAAGGGGGRNNA
jgi:hypothetical protein